MRSKFIGAVALTFLSLVSSAHSAEPVEFACGRATELLVGFFNGVNNTPDQAADSLREIRRVNRDARPNARVEYASFYNKSDGLVSDVVETFVQRSLEIDPTGKLAIRTDLAVLLLQGKTEAWDALQMKVPTLGALKLALINRMRDSVRSEVVRQAQVSASTTYEEHNEALDSYAKRDFKLALVAHSQGNLFLNHAYDYIAPKLEAVRIMSMHVAPASATTRGAYFRADIDLVIGLVDLLGPALPVNVYLATTTPGDVLGHGFVETYMRRAPVQLHASLLQMLDSLLSQPSNNKTLFEVELTAPVGANISMNVVEPDGMRVSNQHSFVGNSGVLLGSNNVRTYLVPCDGGYLYFDKFSTLLTGNYLFEHMSFGSPAGLALSVKLSARNVRTGEDVILHTGQFVSGAAPEYVNGAWHYSPVPMLNVSVTKSSAGRYTVSVPYL